MTKNVFIRSWREVTGWQDLKQILLGKRWQIICQKWKKFGKNFRKIPKFSNLNFYKLSSTKSWLQIFVQYFLEKAWITFKISSNKRLNELLTIIVTWFANTSPTLLWKFPWLKVIVFNQSPTLFYASPSSSFSVSRVIWRNIEMQISLFPNLSQFWKRKGKSNDPSFCFENLWLKNLFNFDCKKGFFFLFSFISFCKSFVNATSRCRIFRCSRGNQNDEKHMKHAKTRQTITTIN